MLTDSAIRELLFSIASPIRSDRWRKRPPERFGGDHHLLDVIALRTFKRAEIETNACGHDAGEQHAGMTSRAGGALDTSVDLFGQEIGFLHDASPQTGGSATLSVTGNVPWQREIGDI
jgi:hypothetical protein